MAKANNLKAWLEKQYWHLSQKKWLPAVIFSIAILIGLARCCTGVFHDEGDNLSVGWLMTQGQILYKDIFSHHFPLAYFWSAAVTSLFGISIIAQRLSILLLTALTFFLAIKITQKPLLISLQLLFWEQLHFLIFGNMMLYQSIISLSFYLLFLLVFMQKKSPSEPVQPWNLFLLGFLVSFTLLGSALEIYPVLIALIFFFVRLIRRQQETTFFKQLLSTMKTSWPFLPGLLILPLLFLGYLVRHQALQDFWVNGVLFNFNYYVEIVNSWHRANVFTPLRILFYLVTLHHPLEVIQAFPFEMHRLMIFILFTAIRLIVVLACVDLARKQKYYQASAAYVILAALLLRNGLQNTLPYLILALFLMCLTLFSPGRKPSDSESEAAATKITSLAKKLVTGLKAIFLILFLGILMRYTISVVANLPNATPAVQFAVFEEKTSKINQIKADCSHDLTLLAYPEDMYLYYLTETPPATPFLFLFPWVDQYGWQEINQALEEKKDQPVLVLFEYSFSDYRPISLLDFVDETYLPQKKGVWYSPGLDQCLSQPP